MEGRESEQETSHENLLGAFQRTTGYWHDPNRPEFQDVCGYQYCYGQISYDKALSILCSEVQGQILGPQDTQGITNSDK